MPSQPYSRPPITEAVIEMRFAVPLDLTEFEKSVRQLSSVYNHQADIRNVGVALGVPFDGPPQATVSDQIGRRMSSDDLTEIAVLFSTNFAVAQLAPYPGWEDFFKRFLRDWTLWKKAVGYRKIDRVGVRFINRIDVPIANNKSINTPIDEADYLNIYPRLPSSIRPATSYGVQAKLRLADIDCELNINSGAVPSPLIGYKSYLLDFDIFMEPEPPQNDEGLYDLLNRIRLKKNEVFEDCVTEQAKEIFRQ